MVDEIHSIHIIDKYYRFH